jgi:hypothetical protein
MRHGKRCSWIVECRAHEWCPGSAVAHPLHPLVILELHMIGLIARWGHNVLISTMAFLTVAMIVFLTR